MNSVPIAQGGSMDDKASVNIEPADNGGFIIRRSWRTGKGDEGEYHDESLIFDEIPSSQEMRKMFQVGIYRKDKTSLRSAVEGASENEDENGK